MVPYHSLFCCEINPIWAVGFDASFAIYDQPAHPDDVNNNDDVDLQRPIGFQTCNLSMFLLQNQPN